MSDEGLFLPPPRWRRGRPRGAGIPAPVLVGLVVGVALIGLTLALAPRSRAGVPAAVAVAATPAPACRGQIVVVDDLVRAGRVATAVALIDAELGRPDLCPPARAALERLRLPLALEELLARRAHPRDAEGQRALAERLPSLWARAGELGVTLPPATEVAQLAYDAQQFLLAKEAFDQALRDGLLAADARAAVAQYSSTLYNLGYWWTLDQGPAYHDGLALLAASACIDRIYGNPSAAAATLLAEKLGPSGATAPRPYPTPLLDPSQECSP